MRDFESDREDVFVTGSGEADGSIMEEKGYITEKLPTAIGFGAFLIHKSDVPGEARVSIHTIFTGDQLLIVSEALNEMIRRYNNAVTYIIGDVE